MKRAWFGWAVSACVLGALAAGCGDDTTGELGGSGGTGATGAGGTGAVGGMGGTPMLDPDRFPWTVTVSLVEIEAVSSAGAGDIDDWCDLDDRGEFFARYLVDPPGPEGASTILNLDFDAGGPRDRRLYGDTLKRTITIESADERIRISSGSSFEEDGILSGDDELSDFNTPLANIPPSVIDFTDVGCAGPIDAPYGYTSALGRTDCDDGCILTQRNTAKSLCYLVSTWCYQNVSPPDR